MSGLDLKIARVRCRISQLQLARTANINPSRLSKIENEWLSPRADEVEAICSALNINPRQVTQVSQPEACCED